LTDKHIEGIFNDNSGKLYDPDIVKLLFAILKTNRLFFPKFLAVYKALSDLSISVSRLSPSLGKMKLLLKLLNGRLLMSQG